MPPIQQSSAVDPNFAAPSLSADALISEKKEGERIFPFEELPPEIKSHIFSFIQNDESKKRRFDGIGHRRLVSRLWEKEFDSTQRYAAIGSIAPIKSAAPIEPKEIDTYLNKLDQFFPKKTPQTLPVAQLKGPKGLDMGELNHAQLRQVFAHPLVTQVGKIKLSLDSVNAFKPAPLPILNQLQALHVRYGTGSSEFVKHLAWQAPALKSLTLEDTEGELTMSELALLSPSLSQIEKLSLLSNSIEENLPMISHFYRHLKRLKLIQIKKLKRDFTSLYFSMIYHNNPELSSLSFRQTLGQLHETDEGLKPKCLNLKELRLESVLLEKNDLKNILQNCPNLARLTLCDCSIVVDSPDNEEEIVEFLSQKLLEKESGKIEDAAIREHLSQLKMEVILM